MKMKKYYYITLFALFLSISLYGQTERLSLSVNGGGSYTMLKNSIPESKSTEKAGYTVNVQFNLAISHSFAIGLGLGYSNYSSDVSLDKYYAATATTDNEGDKYEYRLYGTNLKENQSVNIVEVPLLLILQNREPMKFKPYLQVGVKAMLPVQSQFSCTAGEIETRGYYSQYNVELSNMPNHGFGLFSLEGVSGKLSSKVSYAALMELGANISLGNSYLMFALFGSYGLSSICQSRELFTVDQVYQSLSSVSSNVFPYSIGLKVGMSFPFRLYGHLP